MLGQSVIASHTWTACYIAGASRSTVGVGSLDMELGELETKTELCLSTMD